MIRQALPAAVLGLALAATAAVAQLAVPPADYVRQNARPLPALGRLPDPLATTLAPYRAILFGEIHGTREAPHLALELARLVIHGGRSAWLGLEIPVTEQAALDKFRQTGDPAILRAMPFFNRPFALQDGRASAAMAQMLTRLQKMPDIPAYCIDPVDATTAQARDTGMAREIARRLAEHPGSVAVTLTGNVHASTKAGTPWDASYRPMGYEVAHGVLPAGQVLAIDLRYMQGTAWNSLAKPGAAPVVGLHTLPTMSDLFVTAVPWGAYFLKLPAVSDGYGAVLFWRTLSASPPYVTPGTSPSTPPTPRPAGSPRPGASPVPSPSPRKDRP